jgi:hypothetical protein
MVTLEKGKIYTVNTEENRNIFMYSHGNVASFYIGEDRNMFNCTPGGNFDNYSTYIESNDFDKAWLLECKKQNTFIPEEEFSEIYNSNQKLIIW